MTIQSIPKFAWLPTPISKLQHDLNGCWIIPTGQTVWLRKVILKINTFDQWYELPLPNTKDHQ